MVSIVIPSRHERWLQPTIDDLLKKAEGEVEIIVVLDGAWPNEMIKDDPRVRIFYHGTPAQTYGMRDGINAGMRIARGEWVMKADGHTMWDQGYDVKLIADCEQDWVVVPRRYRLDPDKWEIIEDGRPPIDYMYIEYPFLKPFDITQGLHGAEWKQKHYDRLDVLIDDLMTFQGSAYFMSKKHWESLGEFDTASYGPFTHESQEISNKTWLSGGRVVVNKKTWYAHLHKGRKYGTGYHFTNKQWEDFAKNQEKGRQFCVDYWPVTKDYKYDFKWLVEKFWPLPNWPEDWETRIITDKDKDYRRRPDAKYQK